MAAEARATRGCGAARSKAARTSTVRGLPGERLAAFWCRRCRRGERHGAAKARAKPERGSQAWPARRGSGVAGWREVCESSQAGGGSAAAGNGEARAGGSPRASAHATDAAWRQQRTESITDERTASGAAAPAAAAQLSISSASASQHTSTRTGLAQPSRPPPSAAGCEPRAPVGRRRAAAAAPLAAGCTLTPRPHAALLPGVLYALRCAHAALDEH
jgi:hypothetical protein